MLHSQFSYGQKCYGGRRHCTSSLDKRLLIENLYAYKVYLRLSHAQSMLQAFLSAFRLIFPGTLLQYLAYCFVACRQLVSHNSCKTLYNHFITARRAK